MHNYPTDLFPTQMGYQLSSTSSNKYVYFKQNFLPAPQRQVVSKVLVNPLFNKKVFVNPNYRPTSNHTPVATSEHMPVTNKIHINPRIQSIKPLETTSRKILVNPKVLRNIPVAPIENPVRPVEKSLQSEQLKGQVNIVNPSLKSLAASNRFAQPSPKRIRRLSIRSKFKIVRSHSRSKENEISKNILGDLKLKYPPTKFPTVNKFKLDNRKNNSPVAPKRAKFIFVNKFVSIRDVAKSIPLKVNKSYRNKSLNLLNISGVMYRNSPNSLRRTSPPKPKRSISKIQEKPICKSKYKLIRRSYVARNGPTEEKKSPVRCVRRSIKLKKNISVEKLRKCNIPCLYYQRFGKCKRKDIGKCNKKHDPDQIALCTKFLQGACIDDNCLLSHNVSSEKMPTCKFYLEGTCSKDQCPYLHVRLSPKADICRDFLEGFCRKAQECDKRHQFLCPDYEKKGCAKPRCPYPHGNMVRKYSVFNKHKFAKKSSVAIEEKPREKTFKPTEIKEIKQLSKNENARYYLDTKNMGEGENSGESKNCVVVCNETVCDKEISFRSRPKLGDLPSFIAFEET